MGVGIIGSNLVITRLAPLLLAMACTSIVYWSGSLNTLGMVESQGQVRGAEKKDRIVRVFHVMNIYATKNEKDPIRQPFDQWVTLQSIQRAKKNMHPNLRLSLVCAILESDMEILTEKEVPMCDYRIPLTRSTKTEFISNTTIKENGKTDWKQIHLNDIFKDRELPFVQDVIDAGISVADMEERKDFYIMMTNADIGLTEHFYSYLYPLVKERRKAFTINRLTLKEKSITIRKPTKDPAKIDALFDQIDSGLLEGKKHPGTDCYLMHSTIVRKVNLGYQFPGYPAWAATLKVILRDILARGEYRIIQSSPRGTFHIGDDKGWKSALSNKEARQLKMLEHYYRKAIDVCPIQRKLYNTLTALNHAMCGMVFHEHYETFLKQTQAGNCRYNWAYGWYHSRDKSCVNFILGKGRYPWENDWGKKLSVEEKEKWLEENDEEEEFEEGEEEGLEELQERW